MIPFEPGTDRTTGDAGGLTEEIDRLRESVGKMLSAFDCYCECQGTQVAGEAWRDLAGTMSAAKFPDSEKYGWPAVLERREAEIARLRARLAAAERVCEEIIALPRLSAFHEGYGTCADRIKTTIAAYRAAGK